MSSCTYIVDVGARDVWLVDCGDVEPLLPLLHGKVLKGVLLTHAHFDHIYGLNELLEKFPDCLVYTNDAGREAMLNDKKNLSRYRETPFIFNYPQQIRIVNDGDSINLSDTMIAGVHETTGHHPSCLTFVMGDNVFTGDAYIPGIKVVTNLPGGNKQQADESVVSILLLAQSKIIHPGHKT